MPAAKPCPFSRLFGRICLFFSALALAACVAGNGGPRIESGAAVQVALLVPKSGAGGDSVLAANLENAARLAISDLSGVLIDLRVYDTAGTREQAAVVAKQAVDDGAKIILGPVFAEAANAAGIAAASKGVNVLSFSNNPTIAGGNVFVLGNLFDNTANRLASYAVRNGKRSVLVVYGNGGAELIARDAIVAAVRGSGGTVADTVGFELSQQGVAEAGTNIVARARATGADAVFFTSGTDGALPFLTQLISEQGLPSETAQFIGLQRWDIPPSALTLTGLQGGWFALPDPGLTQQFESRYAAAYGTPPHPIAALAYDGIAAIGALVKAGKSDALTVAALTQSQGFLGVGGAFRLLPNGTNQRALAIAQIQNSQVIVIDPAPRSFGFGTGF